MEITITTKAGKFSMTGREFVEGFRKKLLDVPEMFQNPRAAANYALNLKNYLATYEEEVKTEDDGEEEAYENNGREEAFEV